MSKWKKSRQKIGYEKYGKMGEIIEEGRYGELKYIYKETKNADSSISEIIDVKFDYKNLRTVHYFFFTSRGSKSHEELWQFKDNKKDSLIYKTIFEYDTIGHLIKETEYNNGNKISRLRVYLKGNPNQTISKDSFFIFSNEGISKFDGILQDTTTRDSRRRPIEITQYFNDKFLYRKEFRYGLLESNFVTELRFDNKPNNLSYITEWQYDQMTNQPIRKFRKQIEGINSELKDIYIYNRKQLLVKVLHYDRDKLTDYTKFKYKHFKLKKRLD